MYDIRDGVFELA